MTKMTFHDFFKVLKIKSSMRQRKIWRYEIKNKSRLKRTGNVIRGGGKLVIELRYEI